MISLILSGGSGTRLWPASRTKLPKQFCDIFTESLFVQTCKRLQALGDVQVCTSQEMKVLTEKSVRDNRLSVGQCFYEPFGRNTAPAVALVCRHLQLKGKTQEVVGVYPSDHWIEKADVFKNVLQLAESCAKKGQIATIGIEPDHAATGYGYIESLSDEFESQGTVKAFKVKGFHEKPDQATAQKYIDQGGFHWNSGMFVFSCETMIQAFETLMPEMWNQFSELKEDLSNMEKIYQKVESQSLDYGIMEHFKAQVTIPCDIGWSDLGSWDDVSKVEGGKGVQNNADGFFHEAKNNFVYSPQQKTICVAGVDDLIVIDSDDVILVTKKGETQKIKELLGAVKESKPNLAVDHTYEYRPWGMYQNTWEEESFKTKVIEVDPMQQLSYQSHAKRAEVWVIVEGQGEVVLNDDIVPVKRGTVVEIPVGAKHRMRNTHKTPLKFVEVQQGDYFGEDDIVRYQDDYNRS